MHYGVLFVSKLYHSVFGQCFVNIAFKICQNAPFFGCDVCRYLLLQCYLGFYFIIIIGPQFSECCYAVRRTFVRCLQINVSDITFSKCQTTLGDISVIFSS